MRAEEAEALVRAIAQAGESYYAEFKSAWHYGPEERRPRDVKDVANDIAEAAAAFANSDGGDILVGVEDSGGITGVPYQLDQLRYLLQAPKALVRGADLDVVGHEVTLDGLRVLLFRIAEHPGSPVVTSGGRCLWRRGTVTEPVPPVELERRRNQRLGDTTYEAQPVPEATLDDLDVPWTSLPSHSALVRFSQQQDLHGLLRYWNLLESRNGSVVLRRAPLLLFAREPLRWHPNLRIRVRRVLAAEEGFGAHLRSREVEIRGAIIHLLSSGVRRLGSTLEIESRHGSLFSTSHLLPQDAIEECLVNAVAHRNYAIPGQAIEILLFPDRVEFRSPGTLPEPLTVEDLRAQRGAHRSRNPLIMRVLRDFGWARDSGEGMRRIFGAMSQVELHEPELEEHADTFVVRLSTRSLYDEATPAWIAAYGPFGLQPGERKYLVGLRRSDGRLSVDRLARALGEAFDKTRAGLAELERKGLVWHAPRSRTYHVVNPLSVPHERAFRLLTQAGTPISATAVVTREVVERMASDRDERGVSAMLDGLRESGILAPAGKNRWRLGKSFLEYVSQRKAEAPRQAE